MASTRIPGAKLLALDEASKQITHSIWLDGPRATAEAIGARGYAYEPFPDGEPLAVEPHVLVLYIEGGPEPRRRCSRAPSRPSVRSLSRVASPIRVISRAASRSTSATHQPASASV